MTKEQKLLWEKISQFKIDDENSDFTFSKRLARENRLVSRVFKKGY